jgi:pimeloyl-ACP methyl ester carboxylesterase
LLPSLDALDFLADMMAAGQPSRLTRRTATPTRTPVEVPLPGGGFNPADLYTGAQAPRCGLLLVPGVARGGKDEPRMVALAERFARLGFAVLVPHLATLNQLNVRPYHRDLIVASFAHLASRPEWCPEGRAGIGGLSFAMGTGTLAALDPAIADRVRFIFCIGGYFDLLAQCRFATTGWHRPVAPGGRRGPWTYTRPDHYGRWVLGAGLATHIADPDSQAAFRAMVDRRLPDASAPLDDLDARLTDPDARALLAYVDRNDQEVYEARWEALPGPMRQDLTELDVSTRDLTPLRARLILVHGLIDNLIPPEHSAALHHAVPAGQSHLYMVGGLRHVTMQRPGPLGVYRLLAAVTDMLRERAEP